MINLKSKILKMPEKTKQKFKINKLSSIKTGKGLVKLIKNLHEERKCGKLKSQKRKPLTKKQRILVLRKTDAKCHICGIDLKVKNFQADHVKSHISGGKHNENNYLPSCDTCNNYRWHYLPEEIQLILKLGVFVKSTIENETNIGLQIAEKFTKHKIKLKKRRTIN
jgi:hypothetical protein